MILRNQLIQRHRKQRPLTPTFSLNESHEKCPRSREGIFSLIYRPAQCFVTVSKLEDFFRDLQVKGLAAEGVLRLSPVSRDPRQAKNWMCELGAIGLDGIIAKRLDEPYRSGKRTAMVKIKRIRT